VFVGMEVADGGLVIGRQDGFGQGRALMGPRSLFADQHDATGETTLPQRDGCVGSGLARAHDHHRVLRVHAPLHIDHDVVLFHTDRDGFRDVWSGNHRGTRFRRDGV
jgi:hypothetical protein